MGLAAKRLAAVKPSASMAVSGQAKAMKARGIDVIDLGVGEPDFDTPHHIIEAAVQQKFKRENALDYAASEIIISNGAKQVLFDALMATVEPGDEVLLCAPYFDIYLSMTRVLGCNPSVIETQA
nr:aminotransferase class I/II-fold pyridoxal phosphate-dependent enzyme [Gammaproteobacteria bacterium]